MRTILLNKITNPANTLRNSFFSSDMEHVGKTMLMTAVGPLSRIQLVNANQRLFGCPSVHYVVVETKM